MPTPRRRSSYDGGSASAAAESSALAFLEALSLASLEERSRFLPMVLAAVGVGGGGELLFGLGSA